MEDHAPPYGHVLMTKIIVGAQNNQSNKQYFGRCKCILISVCRNQRESIPNSELFSLFVLDLHCCHQPSGVIAQKNRSKRRVSIKLLHFFD